MKYMKHIKTGLAMLGIIAFTSCSSDYLETTPTGSVSEVTISTSLENIYMALNGIHKEMVSQESGRQAFGGEPGFMGARDCEGDDVTWVTNTWLKTSHLGWEANLNEVATDNVLFWRVYYQWILNANKVLESLEIVENDDPELFDQIKGEALCIRAWAHFNVLQLYAQRYVPGSGNTHDGIPYRTNSAGGELARSTVEETYRLINADLDEAIKLLAGMSPGVTHYSEKVAYGLRARTALAMHDYANAANYAGKAIALALEDGNALMEGDQFMCGFVNITSDTKEAMYAARTPDDKTVYFYSFYANWAWNFNATAIRQGVKSINADTYDTMSETDIRRAWWDPTGEMDVPASNFVKNPYQNRKFTARSTSNAVGEVAFMRLAELYLIQAEALARSGQDAAAQDVFTKFQVTRDPSYVSKGNTGDALIEEIMNSRRVELWAEGFRFYDLKRLNQPIKRGRNFDIAFCTFVEREADHPGWVWEIPRAETAYNPLCKKNH
ncbi:RagB/SusD family nutrient uptake outer membrane protein [Parabacteroides sp. PF5-6]|uniref:RagB/SusD family nutrient uptake outer membrane protein n=1 Tax=Parabacteroides sp. PF5-6 TaxID=1742403 RepID=UPI0024059D60|nr:RagB/SusD family nutrient uptake outer membrane protein [Parabacteroides sp. PF5-6]MDF9829455.1 hypothetical protein [Parabacteroides sp. PF5-6]